MKKDTWLSYYKVWQLNFADFFDIFRITKCGKVILLQSVTDCHCKVCQVLQSVVDCYYKVRHVLQSLRDFVTTKCVRYYKVWQLLQSETKHLKTTFTFSNIAANSDYGVFYKNMLNIWHHLISSLYFLSLFLIAYIISCPVDFCLFLFFPIFSYKYKT